MSFLGSISSYFGGSTKHYNKSVSHLSNASDSAYKVASSSVSGASNLFSTTTAVAAGFAWNSYEVIVGKIIGANAATQLANSMAGIFGGAKITGVLATATEFAALSLVQYPVSCMAALMTTSIIATHPKETFEAVKEFAKATYNFLETGLELTEAVTEAALALGLNAAELLDPAVDSLADYIKSTLDFDDLVSDIDFGCNSADELIIKTLGEAEVFVY